MERRFYVMLAIATGAHAAAYLVARERPAIRQVDASVPTDLEMQIEEAPPAPAPREEPKVVSSEATMTPSQTSLGHGGPRSTIGAITKPTSEAPNEPGTTSIANASPSTTASEAAPVAKTPLDLGLSTTYKPLFLPSAKGTDPIAKKLDSDLKAGVAASSPIDPPEAALVVDAKHAASIAGAPSTGVASFEITTDPVGVVVGTRLIDGGSDGKGWAAVGIELGRVLAKRKLEVPKGAKGVVVRLEIVAAKKETPTGIAPTKVPAKPNAALPPEGTGATSIEGTRLLPQVELSFGFSDRKVTARIVSVKPM